MFLFTNMNFGSMDSVFSELKLRTSMLNNGYSDEKDGDPTKGADVQRFDFIEDMGKDFVDVDALEQEERDRAPMWNCKLVARFPEVCFGELERKLFTGSPLHSSKSLRDSSCSIL